MSHAYHEGLPGYAPGQILHDGCAECEWRAESVERTLSNLDLLTFARAWARANDAYGSRARAPAGPLSAAEAPLLRTLYAVQVKLEQFGHRMGEVPT